MKNDSTTFLGAVASAYVDRYEEMSDLCFVFPNKRSCSFFMKNLADSLGDRVILAPEVLDIAEFAARVSGLQEASRIDLLFRLYNVYCSLLGRSDSLKTEEDLLDFDRFASWGEVLMADFSEVEQYCADAAKLFENVRDYRNISSNFLTGEQLDVIERYFGYRPRPQAVESFWKSVYGPDDISSLRDKFVELWKLLPELYEGLLENLDADGLALPGTIFRRAMEKTIECGPEDLPWSHVVMVGFNLLSTSEAVMFERLAKMKEDDGEPYAEFFWDATGPVLGAESSSNNHTMRDLHRYMKEFPMPTWAMPYIKRSNRSEMPPSITIAAAPSNSAQTKIAAREVGRWLREQTDDDIKEAKAAIIVPDENLLMPLLHSLPEELESVNLTMGYSLRFTAVASFVYHLRRLQLHRRKTGGETGYYNEDVKVLMSHPLVHVLIGSVTANRINGEITRYHLRVVTPGWLGQYSPELADILKPIPDRAGVEDTIEYIDWVLSSFDRALAQGEGNEESDGVRTINTKMERAQISTYRRALTTLLNSSMRHGIEMNFMSVFHLVDRLVGGEKVNFEGRPLQGLQVMGLLETRVLDFDSIIILSMNDKIMPRRARKRTFIPDSLRRGYGLPTSSKSEELYTYYFYRVLSRARDVTLVYDARAGEGMRSGGKSRYLMQLEMIYARGLVRNENYSFLLDSSAPEPQKVVKNDDVMKKLGLYLKEQNGRNLSASALMNYCICPVKFYYKNVSGISDDSPAPDHIDAITQGNIVHDALLSLYFPEGKRGRYLKPSEREILTAERLRAMLEDTETIDRAVRQAVNRRHYRLEKDGLDRSLTGAVAIVAERLGSQVRDVIRHDLNLAPVELIGGELYGNVRWRPGNGPLVNMSYAFDRVDRVRGRLRVVDYKTGSAHVKAKVFNEVFSGTYDARYMLQLLLYAHLLEDLMVTEGDISGEDIEMLIYDVNTIAREGAVVPEIARYPIKGHREVSTDFINGIKEMLEEIFDPGKPFEPTADTEDCRFCRFQALCGKR